MQIPSQNTTVEAEIEAPNSTATSNTDYENPTVSETYSPERAPSQTSGFSADFIRRAEQLKSSASGEVKLDPVTEQKKATLKKAEQWLDVEEVNPVLSKVGPAVASSPLALVEDFYNLTADATNAISSAFGGDKVMQNSTLVADWLPNDTASVVSREISKFMLGYGAAMKGANLVSKASSGAAQLAKSFAAGGVADLVTAQPQADSLMEDMIKRVPFGPDLLELLGADEDDTNFEKRLREVVYGGVTGAMAEGLIHTVKSYRAGKKVVESLDAVPEVPKQAAKEGEAAAEVADIPVVTPRDELPPLPETSMLDENMKPMPDDQAASIMRKQRLGQGAVNEIEQATDAGRVYLNLTKIDNTDEVRKMISNIVSENPDKFAKESYTFEDIAQLAADMDMTPDDLDKWTRAQGLQLGQVLAARHLADEAADAAANAAVRYSEGLITETEAALHMTNAERILEKTRDMQNLSGLILGESNIPTSKVGKSSKQLQDLTRVFGSDIQRIGEEVSKIETGSRAKALARAISTKVIAPVSSMLGQIRYSGMLSNPATHARNIFGGTLNIGTRVGESFTAASINLLESSMKMSKSDPYGVTFSEAYHESLGVYQGILEGFEIAAKKMRASYDDAAFVLGAGPLTSPRPEIKFLGVDPKKAKIPDQVLGDMDSQMQTSNPLLRGLTGIFNGKFVSEALRFEDDFMKHINARMTLNREAYKKGYLEGTSKGLPKDQIEAIIAKELSDPSKVTLQKMFAEAEYNTFTNDPTGTFSKSLVKFSTDNPVMKLVAPFAKTNINALNYKLERIPGVGFLTQSIKKEMKSLDPAVRNRAKAKQAFAATTMAGLAGYLHSRDAIIGSGPKQSERWKMFEQAGYQQNSIKVGDQWVEFRQETPLGGILSIMTSVAELMDITDDEQMVQDMGLVATSIVGQVFNPDYLTSSVGELAAALASNDADKAKAILQVGTDIGTQFLPYSGLIRGVQRELTEAGAIKRETQDANGVFAGLVSTFTNQVLSVYQPSALSVRRDILGHPMKHKQGFAMSLISPFGAMEESKNPVMMELSRLTGGPSIGTTSPKFAGEGGFDSDFITISMPPRTIEHTIADRNKTSKLTPDQYEHLVQLSAGVYKGSPKTLEQTLKETFNDPEYQNSSFRVKGVIAKAIIDKYREVGKKLFTSQYVNPDEIKRLGKAILDEYQDSDILK